MLTIFSSYCLQLSPFTDLDSTAADIESRRQLAKNALIAMLRSWAGIVELTSDEMGLAALVRMLSDNNVTTTIPVVPME